MVNTLSAIRNEIDSIDENIFQLLMLRAELALLTKEYKKEHGLKTQDISREAEIINKFDSIENSKISPSDIKTIYQAIITACRNIQK